MEDLKKVQRLTEGRMLDSEDFHQVVQKAISHNHTHIVCYFLKRGMSAHHLWPAAYENAHASQGVFEQYIANGMDVKTDKNSPIAPPLA